MKKSIALPNLNVLKKRIESDTLYIRFISAIKNNKDLKRYLPLISCLDQYFLQAVLDNESNFILNKILELGVNVNDILKHLINKPYSSQAQHRLIKYFRADFETENEDTIAFNPFCFI